MGYLSSKHNDLDFQCRYNYDDIIYELFEKQEKIFSFRTIRPDVSQKNNHISDYDIEQDFLLFVKYIVSLQKKISIYPNIRTTFLYDIYKHQNVLTQMQNDLLDKDAYLLIDLMTLMITLRLNKNYYFSFYAPFEDAPDQKLKEVIFYGLYAFIFLKV